LYLYFSVQHVVPSLYELIQDGHQGFSMQLAYYISAGAGKVIDFWGKQQHYGNGWLGYKRLLAQAKLSQLTRVHTSQMSEHNTQSL
jgi:hypothetical protein